MNLSEADIIQLENYWSGQLPPTAQAALEKRLSEDPDFQTAATEWQWMITEGFLPPQEEVAEAAAIKKRLLSYQQEEITTVESASSKKPKRSLFTRWVAIGLATAATVLLLFWLTPLSDLWESQAKPSDGFFTHLPRDNANLSNDGPNGRQAYDQKNYAVAYPALLAEVEAGGDSLNLIYAAVAAVGSGQSEKAVLLLKPLVMANNWKLYRAEIQWYLALAYFNQGEKAKAKTLLQAIIEADEDYAVEAKKLILQLE